MIPQILNLGPLPINSFGLMVALAILAGVQRLALSFERAGINPEFAERYALTGGIVGLVGARVWYILESYSDLKDDLFSAIFSNAGFTFYGGFIVSVLVLMLMAIRDKISILKFFDTCGPTLTLAYAIGRLGCQLSGDGDYGIVTDSILGMSYSSGVIATPPGELRFPTPLYESFICAIALIFLEKVEVKSNWNFPGKKFGLYLLLIAAERFLVEFLRINPKLVHVLSEAQIIALIFMLCGSFLLVRAKLFENAR